MRPWPQVSDGAPARWPAHVCTCLQAPPRPPRDRNAHDTRLCRSRTGAAHTPFEPWSPSNNHAAAWQVASGSRTRCTNARARWPAPLRRRRTRTWPGANGDMSANFGAWARHPWLPLPSSCRQPWSRPHCPPSPRASSYSAWVRVTYNTQG